MIHPTTHWFGSLKLWSIDTVSYTHLDVYKRQVLAGNNAGRGAWRWQGEAVKVSDLDGTTSMQLTLVDYVLTSMYISM